MKVKLVLLPLLVASCASPKMLPGTFRSYGTYGGGKLTISPDSTFVYEVTSCTYDGQIGGKWFPKGNHFVFKKSDSHPASEIVTPDTVKVETINGHTVVTTSLRKKNINFDDKKVKIKGNILYMKPISSAPIKWKKLYYTKEQ